MNGSFRKVIFWSHLAVGIAAGVVIAVLCVTGTLLAFEKEIIAWADRDARTFSAPAGSARLDLDAAMAKFRTAYPEAKPSSITLSSGPDVAILFSSGRTNGYYLNPVTGAITASAAKGTREWMQRFVEWHRYLGQSGEARPRGKAITGAANVIFLALAVSGLYLWFPFRVFKFRWNLRGKARDWNWHNTIGFWSAPVLIVLTLTALPLSYKWANDGIYKLTGTEPPAQGGRGGEAPKPIETPKASEGKALPLETLVARVRAEIPKAGEVTVRLGGRGPMTFSVKEKNAWPRFSSTQLTLDASTGAVVKSEGYANFNVGRKIRMWTRFLHTGEALGPIGQAVAGLASFGGVVLTVTGFTLAARRFLGRQGAKKISGRVEETEAVEAV